MASQYPPDRGSMVWKGLLQQQMSRIQVLSQEYMNTPQRGTSSQTNTWAAFMHSPNCVKATFNHGLWPSDVDWGDRKEKSTKMLKFI